MGTDLFSVSGLDAAAPHPLADALRPATLDDVVGQPHLLGPGGRLTRIVRSGDLGSLILWGPPGTGKTTLARLLAGTVEREFVQTSAIFTGVADLKKMFERARRDRATGRGTLLFVDEIHRFNRAQQDAFLPVMEDGTITLVGATTENPSFELNAALLSRAQVLTLQPLDSDALDTLLARAEELRGPLPVTPDARRSLLRMADGDGRAIITLAEEVYRTATPGEMMDSDAVQAVLQRRAPAHDKDRDGHFNLISALQKSVRGSDPDAALYYLLRMIEGGEDRLYLARRIVRMASEDIGLADPHALTLAIAARDTMDFLGSPEGELALAEAVVYLALSPKSNAVYKAFKAARAFVRDTPSLPPPKHILNAPTRFMREEGYGAGYAYDHDSPDGISGQSYFPEGVDPKSFYHPTDRGSERALSERLAVAASRRAEHARTGHAGAPRVDETDETDMTGETETSGESAEPSAPFADHTAAAQAGPGFARRAAGPDTDPEGGSQKT